MVGRVYLGLYEVTSPLGQGSMGCVYLARHRTNGRQVVLKVMHPHIAGQRKFRELFQREMELMTRFKHPYAVTLFDASLKDPQGPCLVMEYIRGVDFDRLQQHYRRFTLARIGRLIGQLCEVLHAAHSQGIIHRDLKLSNLMVADWGKPLERIKVMDFGLAKLTDEEPGTLAKKTPSGPLVVSGTAEYMCPEQIRGQPMDHRGDLYSVGVILYELLTGRLPFERGSVQETLHAHVNAPVPSFASVGLTNVSPAIEAVITSCLAKDPARRPASAWDLGLRLEEALGQKILDHDGSKVVTPPPGPARGGPATHAPKHRPTILYGVRHTQLGLQLAPKAAAPAPAAAPPVAVAPADDTDSDEVTYRLELRQPNGLVLEKAGKFVEQRGGKVVQRSPDGLRALIGQGNGTSARYPSGLNAVLTEMELHIGKPEAGRPSGSQMTITLRPLGTVSYAATSLWRSRCEQIHADLRNHLGL